MDNQVQSNEEMEIDLLELAKVVCRKWFTILLCMVILAVTAFGVSTIAMTPQYTASSMIYILSNTTEEATSMTEIQVGASLAEDFMIIGKSRPVVEEVIKKLDLNMTYGELVENLVFEQPTNSHVLKISLTNPDAELAANVVNMIADLTKERIADVMGTEEPDTVEEAVVPTKPSSPNVMKNIILGALVGAILAIGVIVVRYLLDDTIKDEDDVKKYLQLNTLAAIPLEKRGGSSKRK